MSELQRNSLSALTGSHFYTRIPKPKTEMIAMIIIKIGADRISMLGVFVSNEVLFFSWVRFLFSLQARYEIQEKTLATDRAAEISQSFGTSRFTSVSLLFGVKAMTPKTIMLKLWVIPKKGKLSLFISEIVEVSRK